RVAPELGHRNTDDPNAVRIDCHEFSDAVAVPEVATWAGVKPKAMAVTPSSSTPASKVVSSTGMLRRTTSGSGSTPTKFDLTVVPSSRSTTTDTNGVSTPLAARWM